MIALCHTRNDTELMMIRAVLLEADIPFHIQGENFGSLFPGLQIPYFNERRIDVPEENFERALKLIEDLRKTENSTKKKT